MQFSGFKVWYQKRFALAIIAGLVLAAAFPLSGIAGFAWMGPGMLAAAALGKRGAESFRIGYVGGLTYYLASLYWLLWIPYRWHGLPLGPALGWVALAGYLALFPAVWVWLLSLALRVSSFGGEKTEVAGGVYLGKWVHRTLWAVFGAALWVALEMIIARLWTGFPWNLLGASQYELTPLIQVSKWTGIYGVSFLVVWTSLALLLAMFKLMQHPGRRSTWAGEVALPMLTVALVFASGYSRIRNEPTPTEKTVRITLVQPSIPQTLIWDSSGDDQRLEELLRLTERALSNRTDLVLWPEAAVPNLLRYEEKTFKAITDLARRHKVWMIIGADDAEPQRNPAPGEPKAEYYNSSFLINPEGELVDNYRKRGLVIFGEYIPLKKWLPFLKWFTPIEGGFTRGERPAKFRLREPSVQVSVLICFEDIFPGYGREASDPDTDFLVNLTNNGWFGETAAQWQHAVSAVFRAVENNIPLVRATNNGLTCWVDRFGQLHDIFRDKSGSVYGHGYLHVLLPLGQHREPTFYNRHGDLFGWGCVGYAGLGILRMWRILGKQKQASKPS